MSGFRSSLRRQKQSHPIAKNVFTSLKDLSAISGGSLLVDRPRPEGFDEQGRHVLNDRGEFRLVEMWYPGGPRVVEYREDIKDAFDRVFFGVSEARALTDPADRVGLAKIVHAFVDCYLDGKSAKEAAEAFGREILVAIHAADIEADIRSLTNRLTSALRSEAIARGRMRDKQGNLRKMKVEAAAVLEAAKIFEQTGERPGRRAIMKALKAQGYELQAADWRDVFRRAKLSRLPW
jgi:hypothetical protein